MKRILLRVVVLGIVVALGLFAIAQAQRSPTSNGGVAGASAAVAADNAFDTSSSSAGSAGNPLRANSTTAAGSTAPNLLPPSDTPPRPIASDPPLGKPAGRKAASDPFLGLHDHPLTPAASAAATVVPAAAQDPRDSRLGVVTAGEVPATDRYATPTPRASELKGPPPGGDRYATPRADPPPARAELPHWPPLSAVPAHEDAPAADATASLEGTGQPGDKQLEGPQVPQLTIQKIAPAEIQVGRPATFHITVRNTGQSSAGNVEVHDQVPRGTRLLGSTPHASQGPQGELLWNLGTLKPGEESSVELQLMPTAEGEIGSVATVHFDAAAAARTVATQPKLTVESTAAASRVMIGEQVNLTVTVSNPGSGVASGVVLEAHLPAGLQHPAGSELEYSIGDLRPGERRKLELPLVAQQPGTVTSVLAARGEGNLRTESRCQVEVLAPQLDIALSGPKRRYLEREATYQLALSNPGTAAAQQVELVAYLPSGLKFVSANNAGQYDQNNRAVHWYLDELPVHDKGVVELVTMPIEPGEQNIKLRGTAQRGVAVERQQPVLVESIAAVQFQLSQDKNPIEVGGQTTYEIHVTNQGSKAAANVSLTLLLPPQLKPIAAEGPSRYAIDNGRILFDGLPRLAPKADLVYRVRVQSLQAGDLRVRCQLATDEMQVPLTQEESTRVYADE